MSAVDRFVSCALKAVGGRYCTPPNEPRCTDCSGLVKRCYREATGITITGSSYEQAKLGKAVKNPEAGDILVYGGGSHVGIVVGQDRAVHALNRDLGIKETRVKGANLGLGYVGARRLDFGGRTTDDDGAQGQTPTGEPDATTDQVADSSDVGVRGAAVALAEPISLTTAVRSIPALPLTTWEAEFAARQSPLTKTEIGQCFAACGGLAIALDQAIGETSLKDADAIRDKNLLRLTEPDGSTFKKYSEFWKPFAEYLRRIFDPAYKGGVYFPKQATALTYADGGQADGHGLSIAGYKVIYQGGRGCLDSRGATCANDERYDPNRPMTGISVVNDPNAPSINRSIAASMLRMERWFGTPTPGPAPDPGDWVTHVLAGSTVPLRLPRGVRFVANMTPLGPNRSGRRLNWTGTTQHTTNNVNLGTGALHHSNWQKNGTPGHPDGKIGVHFYVDDKEIVQCIPVNEQGVHSGDWRNQEHTAVELCVNSDRDPMLAERNSRALQAGLLRILGKTAMVALYPHTFNAEGHCPRLSVSWSEWERLVDAVNGVQEAAA